MRGALLRRQSVEQHLPTQGVNKVPPQAWMAAYLSHGCPVEYAGLPCPAAAHWPFPSPPLPTPLTSLGSQHARLGDDAVPEQALKHIGVWALNEELVALKDQLDLRGDGVMGLVK